MNEPVPRCSICKVELYRHVNCNPIGQIRKREEAVMQWLQAVQSCLNRVASVLTDIRNGLGLSKEKVEK